MESTASELCEFAASVQVEESTDIEDAYQQCSEEKLQIERMIGHGSCACAYLANGCSKSLDGKVVLKFGKSKPTNGGTDNAAMLRREVKSMNALTGHPNIVDFFGMARIDDGIEEETVALPSWALQIEYCSGGDLHDAVTKSRFSELDAHAAMRGIMSGITHIHENDYVHRDIKPENAFMTRDGTVKIADFGICCQLSNDLEMKRKCGSLGYCAPEILLGKNYGTKVDIFSAGALLYFIVSGKRAFSGSTHTATMKKTITSPVNFRRSMRLECLSNGCKDLIEDLLVKDPALRPTAHEALQDTWILHGVSDRNPCWRADQRRPFLASYGTGSSAAHTHDPNPFATRLPIDDDALLASSARSTNDSNPFPTRLTLGDESSLAKVGSSFPCAECGSRDVNDMLDTRRPFVANREVRSSSHGTPSRFTPRSPQQAEIYNSLDRAVWSKVTNSPEHNSERFSDLSTVYPTSGNDWSSSERWSKETERCSKEEEVSGRVDRNSFKVNDDTEMLSEPKVEPKKPEESPSAGRIPFCLRLRRNRMRLPLLKAAESEAMVLQ